MAETKGFYEVVGASAVTVTPRKQQISKGSIIVIYEALASVFGGLGALPPVGYRGKAPGHGDLAPMKLKLLSLLQLELFIKTSPSAIDFNV
jgi:hypothetical protein